MKKIITNSIIILLGWMIFSHLALASSSSDPVGLLKSLADQMIQGLKNNKASLKSNPQLVYSLANKIIVPHADLAEMSKKVLPRGVWNQATPEQRSRFQKEFTTLLVRTYASALSDYRDEVVHFSPVKGGTQNKSKVEVKSKIVRSDGPSIDVKYRLMLQGSEWKLYDLSVEGVSLLESFRSQFADKLSHGNINDLIKELVSHNAKHDG